MTWNRAYWDILYNLYWNPRYLGFHSVSHHPSPHSTDSVEVSIKNFNVKGRLYTRQHRDRDTFALLQRKEEILNHILSLALSVLPKQVVCKLLLSSCEDEDDSPFRMLGYGLGERYGWGSHDHVQPDVFLLSDTSHLVVESKLGSFSSIDQVLKYIALFVSEEQLSKKKRKLFLLFLAPEQDEAKFQSKCGLMNWSISREFPADNIQRCKSSKLRMLLQEKSCEAADLAERVAVSFLSWNEFVKRIELLAENLDATDIGHQTLQNVLLGLKSQIEDHMGTGVLKPMNERSVVKGRVGRLAEFAARISDPGASAGSFIAPAGSGKEGDPMIIGYYSYSDLISEFVDMCYKAGWILDFDWGKWLQTEEAKRFLSRPDSVQSATEMQLAKLLTALVRQDRLFEGSLAKAFDSGTLRAIAERAVVIERLK